MKNVKTTAITFTIVALVTLGCSADKHTADEAATSQSRPSPTTSEHPLENQNPETVLGAGSSGITAGRSHEENHSTSNDSNISDNVAAVAPQAPPMREEFKRQADGDSLRMERERLRSSRQDQLAKLSAPRFSGDHGLTNRTAPTIHHANEPTDRENYLAFEDQALKLASAEPVSTFSIDVDTGAYANVRRFLQEGRMPPSSAVRTEELINYFGYDYPAPTRRHEPFRVTTELAATPWNDDTLLMHIGIKGFELPAEKRPATNLVFLIDVSGSMNSPKKLPLLKNAFKLLTQQLNENDRISMVVYAGASGVVLEPTAGNDQAKILAALDALSAGGSTNGGAGIRLAYAKAKEAFIKNGINRVILATDGDFNVGTVNFDALLDLVKEQRGNDIFLTTLGFGTGNYNDHLTEQLADVGNGHYAYIDSLNEARKVLVEEISSTLVTIAKDVKIQVEFNPDVVAEYRLIGYENRVLNREDFNNDKVDAGDIGAGHTVTALYEVTLADSRARRIDPLRYSSDKTDGVVDRKATEMAFLRLRYKRPDQDVSRLIETPIKHADVVKLKQTTDSFRFAAAVAAFGQQLRGAEYLGEFDYDDILDLSQRARGADNYGYRAEFGSLVRLARDLSPTPTKVAERADD